MTMEERAEAMEELVSRLEDASAELESAAEHIDAALGDIEPTGWTPNGRYAKRIEAIRDALEKVDREELGEIIGAAQNRVDTLRDW